MSIDPEDTQILRLRELIETAEANLRSAKQIINDIGGGISGVPYKQDPLAEKAIGLHATEEKDGQVIEGVFDGQNMIGPNQKAYPVPANYASKSKLIPGDILKLSISLNGSFIYKQIGPIERQHIKGVLAYEDGQYKVLTEGKSYQVILASVTYFKAEVGDTITLIVPEEGDSDWGAIENVIPRLEASS
ncbi:hypothetical protein HN748_02850 [Candidatus Peregrinibacteria bacterium]|jgi:hypothetical protein|nr:hypothetical protein [Candidatus Peregrinibacteria bacterium]MBT7484187.1 hypothetical protein [Candidatus Peregrinibacteria bacterium]MBT7703146.1 hypothetical protein [Candidatus Peregrinibacteria bacterium]